MSLPDTANATLMRQAIALATENVTSGRGGPFGALIARGGEIVATGVNLVTATNDPTAHAEVTAIRRAAAELGTFTLAGCELYTSCEPCPMCMAASYWARLDAVIYGNSSQDAQRAGFDDAMIYDELARATSARSMPMQQMLREEAWASFAAWEASGSRITY